MNHRRLALAGHLWVPGILGLLGACSEQRPTTQGDPNLFRVVRDNLPITVKENGELQAIRETIVRSEVEGQRTIIFLAPEGSTVKQGDKLVELDVSDLVEKRATQGISVAKAENALNQARKEREILQKELTAKANTATSNLRIAEMQLERYLGKATPEQGGNTGRNEDMVEQLQELVSTLPAAAAAPPMPEPAGDGAAETAAATPPTTALIAHVDPRNYANLVRKVTELLEVEGTTGALQRGMGEMANRVLQQVDRIRLAMAELKIMEDSLVHSRRLASKQFMTRTQLEKEELQYQNQVSKVKLAWNDLDLLINYTLAQERIKLTQDVDNAKLEHERVLASNAAAEAKADSGLESAQQEYTLAKERLDNFIKQIGNGVLYAPTPGLVVYARVDRDRRGGEAIREGLQVRERQELIILPDNSKMRCIVKVQEAQVEKVNVGQPAYISVEAKPGEVLTGRVSRVAPVADSGSSWMGNDKKVYTTIVDLDADNPDNRLKSRMAAAVTIVVDEVKNTLPVPMQAVRRDRSVNYVWKQTPQGPVAVEVKTGNHNSEKVEILDGVAEGDTIYRTPPPGVPEPKFAQPTVPVLAPAAPGADAGTTPGAAASNGTAMAGDQAPGAGNRGARRGGGQGGMAAMNKPLADMTPEELQQFRDGLSRYDSMLERAREMMTEEQVSSFESSLAQIRSALDKNDLEAAQAARDKLRSSMPRMGRGGGGGAPAGGPPGGG